MRKMRLAAWAWMALALALAGCSGLHRDPAADQQARAAVAALRRGDWRALDPQLSPALARDPQLHAKLEAVRAAAPGGTPTAVRLLQAQRNAVFGGDGGKTSSLTYLYSFPHQALVVNVVFDRSGPAPTIAGIHLLPVDPQQAARNRFFAPGKAPAQWLMLAAAVLSPLLMVAAAVIALRTRALEARWLWAILAFAGVGAVWMNWTTGETGVRWLAVNLVGVSVTRALPPLTPWVLHVTLPLGALAVLARVWAVRRGGPPTP